MTRVKICGITNLEDALYAVECGADMLGFNFYEKSPRHVEPATALEIAGRLPGSVTAVGVFVNMNPHAVADLADSAGLAAVQLHGDEDGAYVAELRKYTNAIVIKALRIGPDFPDDDVNARAADAVLLDAYSAEKYGGTGSVFDWDLAVEIKKRVPSLYLAGGLTPENVSEAVRQVRPFAVDVASGVEASPGRKDADKVAAFVHNAKNA